MWTRIVVLLAWPALAWPGYAQKSERAVQEVSSAGAGVATFGTTVVVSSGLRGELYLLPAGTQYLPRFSHRKPVGTLYTTSLNIPPRDFSEGFPGITDRIEWFAIDYTGKFWIEQAGQYRFLLNSDDGSKLYLDRKSVIDNDGVHAPATCVAAVELNHGVHTIRVSYFQGPRYQLSLILAVARLGGPWYIFDTTHFAPPAGPVPESSDPAKKERPVGKIEGGRCGAR